jgi:hypothetical protein
MPKTPKGSKRPADVVANAVRVMQIATGQITEDESAAIESPAAQLGRLGGKARAAKLSAKKRSQIAKKAARSAGRAAARQETKRKV